MSHVLSEHTRQQVLALGRLGWSLRRIEDATGVRRETASGYLRAAAVPVRGRGGRPRDWPPHPATTPGGVHRPPRPQHRPPRRRGCRKASSPSTSTTRRSTRSTTTCSPTTGWSPCRVGSGILVAHRAAPGPHPRPQARARNAFFRYKSIIGESLGTRSPGGQMSATVLACNILDRMSHQAEQSDDPRPRTAEAPS